MSNCSPIYDLLHQEIKACADHLLEISQKKDLSAEKDSEHILERLNELHHFASKVRSDGRYHPLNELKKYLENTMIRYQDEQNRLLSMRLSEAVSLLGIPTQTEMKFKSEIVRSLKDHFFCHFRENSKPGHPLFRKLVEIKKI
jgi:replicative superfamily II helicase